MTTDPYPPADPDPSSFAEPSFAEPSFAEPSFAEQYDRLAQVAENLAYTAEASATLHDQMADRLPSAAEHAARDRLFAAAERRAAQSYRAHELPSKEVRQAVRAARPVPEPDDRIIDREQRDDELEAHRKSLELREQRLREHESLLDQTEP